MTDVQVLHGDALELLPTLDAASVDAVVTDPPYGLEFMGREWDAPWRKSGSEWSRKRATGADWKGDERDRPGRLYMRSFHYTCTLCGKQKHQHNDAQCPEPDYERVMHEPTQLRAYQEWCELWAVECLRVLKPGGYLLAFGGTRTHHRLACAIEDAGFEIRDSIAWLYGSGFPKSLNVAKAIASGGRPEDIRRLTMGEDYEPSGRGRVNYDHGGASVMNGSIGEVDLPGAARRWSGWGTALKPAHEPIVVARKPLAGTVAANVLAHGTGALNIDGCRVASGEQWPGDDGSSSSENGYGPGDSDGWEGNWTKRSGSHDAGRWPPNVVLDEAAAAELDRQSGNSRDGIAVQRNGGGQRIFNQGAGLTRDDHGYGGEGGASRFFPTFRYEPKAPADERPRVNGTSHPTVKPLALIRWLVRLVTPPGGLVLDPFAGSGTTGEACIIEGFDCVLIEREADYLPLIHARLDKPIQPTLGVA